MQADSSALPASIKVIDMAGGGLQPYPKQHKLLVQS